MIVISTANLLKYSLKRVIAKDLRSPTFFGNVIIARTLSKLKMIDAYSKVRMRFFGRFQSPNARQAHSHFFQPATYFQLN